LRQRQKLVDWPSVRRAIASTVIQSYTIDQFTTRIKRVESRNASGPAR
jgi:hypothetical protein